MKDVEFVKGFGLPVLAVISRIRNQQEEDQKQRRTKRVLSIAGVYLLFLLCFPLMEIMGLTYVDNLLDNLRPSHLVQGVKDKVR